MSSPTNAFNSKYKTIPKKVLYKILILTIGLHALRLGLRPRSYEIIRTWTCDRLLYVSQVALQKLLRLPGLKQ